MFVDIAKIKIKAGDGGAGAVAFHREKYVASGVRTAATAARAATLFSLLTTILQRLRISDTKENMQQRTACPERETKSTAKTEPTLKSKFPAAQ